MGTNSPVFDDTLSHVIYNVLGLPHDGPFDKAIRTYSAWTITHLLCIPDEHIDGLYYLDDDGNETPLPTPLRDLLWILQCYVFHYLKSQGGPKTLDSKYWASLTAVEFNKFWYNTKLVHHYRSGVDPPEHPARDPDAFSVLKDITSLDSWLLSFIDVAQTQPYGVCTALEKSYTPMDQLDTELFMENQKFLFDVMRKSLQKCKLAKMTILEHYETHDARAAYWSLIDLSKKMSFYPVLEDI